MLPGNPEYPRDTFAGKILTTFQNQFPVCKFLSDFYRQKCRAAAEILGVWEGPKPLAHSGTKITYSIIDFVSLFPFMAIIPFYGNYFLLW